MKCSHCYLDFKKDQMLEKYDRFFCCTGCLRVYEIINQMGLNEFYDKLTYHQLTPIDLNDTPKDYDHFIKKTKEGFSEIYLIIHNIHCQACIWLNEKALINKDGILEININSINHKAHIVFDETIISLDEILQTINSIGYKASAYDPLKQETKAKELKRDFYARLVVAIACVMNIMWIAIAKYAGFFSGMDAQIKDILNFAEFILATPVIFYTGAKFYINAYNAIKYKSINMDLLVITGSSMAYLYSIWAMFSRVGEVYFDSVAMIICFVFIGKYLELLSRKKASDTLDGLNDFLKAEVLVYDGANFRSINPYEVKVGDIIKLKNEDKVLIDGICEEGGANMDLSSLSGENEPIWVEKGSFISSASIVLEGEILYKATKLYEDSKLARIITLLESASTKKAKIESIINQISIYFSRTILSLAFICLIFWLFKAPFELALVHTISLIIIACPCALALATPVSTLVALGRALKYKVLFKSSSIIEDLSKCNIAIFDKTGVLTKAKLDVYNFYYDPSLDEEELLAFVSLSNHPISYSIAEFLTNKGIKRVNIDFKDFKNIKSKGFRASCGMNEYLGVNIEYAKELKIKCTNSDNSNFVFIKNNKLLAQFELKSTIREGAKELLTFLKKNNYHIIMLTGDNQKAAQIIAKELNITDFHHSCSPEYKMQIVKDYSKNHKVLMIGDGINDALALKTVAVGISLKEGTQLAIESSDVLLLRNDLYSLLEVLKLSKNTLKIIKQNLAFSLCYNAFTIPLAFLGLINPLFAALSMSFSSIIVVLNALRIR